MNEGGEVSVPTQEFQLELLRYDDVLVREVKAMVAPKGACSDMATLRVGQQPLISNEYFKDELHPKIKDMYDAVTPNVEIIRGYLRRIMDDEKATTLLASLPPGAEVSREEIQKLLGLSEGYSYVVNQLYFILNKNVDPELVAIPMLKFTLARGLRPEIADALRSGTGLLMNFVELTTDFQFWEEFSKSNPGGKPYSPELSERIKSLIDRWMESITKQTMTSEELDASRSALEDFFNFNRKYWPQFSETGLDTLTQVQQLTLDAYFESRLFNSIGELSDWHSGGFTDPFINNLRNYAIAVERGKYLAAIYKRSLSLYQRFFPEIYAEPAVLSLAIEDPNKPWHSLPPTESCDEANGYWSRVDQELGIKSGTLIRSPIADEIAQEDTFHFSGPSVKRKVDDLITMTHEDTHAIYEKLVRGRRSGDKPLEDYRATADHAINEGFAVLMELLMGDQIRANAESLGFSKQESDQFETMKTGRLYRLKRNKNGYTEGTYRILHKVFVEGAGRGALRDLHKGLSAVRDFLAKLDPNKTIAVKRDSPEYQQALKEGNPSTWLKLFTTPEAEKLQTVQ